MRLAGTIDDEAFLRGCNCRRHCGAAGPAVAGKATLNLVLVLDGLRPDSITEQETPNLWRLREEGVNFPNGHAVFPTVTRANAAAIGTGVYPDRNGIFGNQTLCPAGRSEPGIQQ